MPDRLLHEGQLFGNYRLVRLVGRGGFADVYLARHIHIRRQAAIKLLHTQMDRGTVQRFKREAQIVADLHHPHIISLLDFGVHSEHIPYLVMEYAASGTLRQRHPRGTVLSPDRVLGYIAQIAEALDFAHRKSIIHRDVKPENMLLNEQDTLLLSDFGIATLTSESGAQETPSVAGTTTYMAPEQLRGKTRPESDQYALAVVVYEWLCGTPPFQGSSTEIAVQHVTVSPPSLHARNPHIPLALEEVVNIALAKDPAQRYPSVTALVEEFRLALYPVRRDPNGFVKRAATSHNPVPRRRQTMLRVPAQTQRPSKPASQRVPSYSTVQPSPGSVSRRTLVLAAGSLALLGGVGGLAWFARQNTHTTGGNTVVGVSGRATAGATRATNKTSTPTSQSQRGKILSYHKFGAGISGVAWLPKQMRIAVGCNDNTAQVWYVDTNSVQIFQGFNNQVSSVTWSPDGTRIAAGSYDNTVQVWDVTDGTHILTCSGHQGRVYTVVWSPNGKYIASGSADNTVMIWDAASGNSIYTYLNHSNWVRSVAWSYDSKYIASGSHDSTVQVWNPATKKTIYTHTRPGIVVYTVTWSPDGKRIAAGNYEGTVDVWNAFDGLNAYSYEQHSDSVFAVAWSPDGKYIVSGSADTTVHVWNSSDGSNTFNFRGHNATVDALAWSYDSTRIVSGSADKSVEMWQAI